MLVPSEHWNHMKEQIRYEDWIWLWRGPGCELMFGQDLPYPGALRGMRRLAAMSDVAVISHRPRSAAAPTLKWLSSVRAEISSVHILGAGMPKSNILPHADVYIDDKPEVVLDYLENTSATVLVPIRSWNLEFLESHKTIKRVVSYENWKEVTVWVRTHGQS